MRNVRTYVLSVSLFASLVFSSPALATPADRGGDRFTRFKNFIVKVLDDVAFKVGLPPG